MENGQKKQIKVAIIGYKLADGGLERVFANLTNLLHENGVEVHTIILESKFTYKYSGKLLVLGKYSKLVKYFKLKLYLKKNKIASFRNKKNCYRGMSIPRHKKCLPSPRMVDAKNMLYMIRGKDTMACRFESYCDSLNCG